MSGGRSKAMKNCKYCGGEMEPFEVGSNWESYRCVKCGHIESNEPDWDSMKGGHDDY